MIIINKTYNEALIMYYGKYYYLSYNGKETMAFQAKEDGTVISWEERGGAKDTKIDEALMDIRNFMWNPVK